MWDVSARRTKTSSRSTVTWGLSWSPMAWAVISAAISPAGRRSKRSTTIYSNMNRRRMGRARPTRPARRSIDIARTAVYRANQRIVGLNRERGAAGGPRHGNDDRRHVASRRTSKAIVFHVGDSRLYRFRAGRLDQITRDHSLYQAWVDAGRSGEPPNRNIIMRALGIVEDVEADISIQRDPGGRYLPALLRRPERHGPRRHHHRHPGRNRTRPGSSPPGASSSRKPTTTAARTT